jgi:hypothetical protein
VSVTSQAANPESALCRFLDARLPTRRVIAEQWAQQARQASWSGIAGDVDPRALGLAVEVRIGLDLASTPGYWDLLSFLPPGRCEALLRGAGYSPAEHLADTGTVDPLLLEWSRSSSPITCGEDQRDVLVTCWQMAQNLGLVDSFEGHSAQLRRSIFVHVCEHMGRDAYASSAPDQVIQALSRFWRGYLLNGRRRLMDLGERVVLSPQLAAGFGIADLIVGHCCVEIKAVLEPAEWFGQWLNQLLGYALLDWFDMFRLDAVGVYLGWQACLITTSLAEVLRSSSRGPTPSLEGLRADFRQSIQPDLDFTHKAQLHRRYPPPVVRAQPGV